MGFTTQQNFPSADIIVLAEFDIPIEVPEYINYEAGVWTSLITPGGLITVTDDHAVTGYYRNDNTKKYNVQSFIVGSIFFTKVASLASLRLQNKSFYYDVASTRIYFHFDRWEYPPIDGRRIRIGTVEGYCNKADSGRLAGTYYLDTYYEPRISAMPSLSRTKDPLQYGILSFDGGQVTLLNTDGYFDDFADREMIGQPFRVLLGLSTFEYIDFERIFTGYIDDFSFDFTEIKLNIKDTRAQLTQKLPTHIVTLEEFQYVADKYIDKYIPLAYGQILNASPPCVNESDPAASYYFYFMDTSIYAAASIEEVRVKDLPVTPIAINLDEGYFILSSGQCMPEGTMEDVTIDFHGADIQGGKNIIIDLCRRYADLAYIPENFNIAEFAEASPNDREVGLYISEREDLIAIIEKICTSIDGFFYPQDDGRFTLRIYDPDRTITKTVQSDEWLSEPSIDRNMDNFLSSVEIKFSPDISKSEFQSYINTDYEAEAYRKYKTKNETAIETILADRDDAIRKSETVMERAKDVLEQVTRKLHILNFDLDIMDFIIAEHTRINATTKLWKIYEINRINKKVDTAEVELTMSAVRDYAVTEPEFYYTQGVIFWPWIFNTRLFGRTDKIEV